MINRTIKLLMFSDIFVITGFGLIDPILAIFIKENLTGGTIFAAGLASTLFLLTKCLIQLPFSRYVDTHEDKVRWLIIGTFFISLVPFIYIFSDHIYFIYIAQIVFGVGSGFAYPTWLGLFSTHLDKEHESYEWSLYSTLSGLGTAATAAIGAAVAEFIGFNWTFFFVGIMSMIGCFILIFLSYDHSKLAKIKILHFHKKRKMIK